MRACRMPMALLLVASGCLRGDAPVADVPQDPGRARSALVAALDAWKDGQAKALPRRNPPIRLADEDLAAGWRLTEYEIEEPDAPVVPNKDVAVILSLRDAKGKTARREARYQVSTEPGLAVLRSDR